MKTVYRYAWAYKWPMLIAFSLTLIELFIELAQPLFIGKIIDDGIIAQDGDAIIYWGLIMAAATFVAFLSGIANSFFAAHAAQGFAYDLRQATYKHLQKMTLATFLTFPTASVMTRLTNDVNIVQRVLFMGLRIMSRAPLVVIGSIIMAFFVNWKLAIIFLIGTPLLLIFLSYMVKTGGPLFGQVQRQLDGVNRTVRENLQAIRLVKASARETYEAKRFGKVADDLKERTMKALRTMEWTMPILLLMMNVMIIAIVWVGSFYVNLGTAQVGEVVSVMNYALRMTGSFSMFSFLIVLFSRAKASSERIEEILVAPTAPEQKHVQQDAAPGEWVFHDVSFAYENQEKEALQQLSLRIRPGEKLAILGETGSGKSTLVQLMLRLFEPTQGHITYGGVPLEEWPVERLRQSIGYVPQQAELVSGTIADNLRWGKKDATEEEMYEALRRAQMFESIERLPKKLDTLIGQQGVNFSGGQKQRLSIARALLRTPDVLILDDSTSALDVKTEQALFQALEPLQMTLIVITQKVSTASRADRIVVLHEGTIDGVGTNEELRKTSDVYKTIVASQEGEEANE